MTTYESAVAAWIAAAETIAPLAHNATAWEQYSPEARAEDRAAERRGDYMSERDQDQLAMRRAG